MIYIKNKKNYKGPGYYIGRPGPLGNPFSHLYYGLGEIKVKSRDESVDRYNEWLECQLKSNTLAKKEIDKLVRIAELDDLTLICWCKPERCHGDIIKEVIEKILKEKDNNKDKDKEYEK